MVACDEEGTLENFQLGSTTAIAGWVSSPDGDLILSDPTSSLDFEIEFNDGGDGSSVDAVTMTVSDGTTTATILTQTSFTANADGVMGFSGSISLDDIATALGTTASSFDEGDEFDFDHTLTVNGVEIPPGNAATFTNDVDAFGATIATETVSLASGEAEEGEAYVNNTDGVTIVLGFANDFTVELETLPTVEWLDYDGVNQGSTGIGTVTAVQDEDGADSVYTFTYANAAATDTVSFVVSGASAFTSGFVMENDTLEDLFIVDNVAIPDPISVATASMDDETLEITAYYLDTVTSGRVEVEYLDPDDGMVATLEVSGVVTIAGSGSSVVITLSESDLPEGVDGDDVTGMTLIVEDQAGNETSTVIGLI